VNFIICELYYNKPILTIRMLAGGEEGGGGKGKGGRNDPNIVCAYE
jgi:hypothetical protein